MSVDDKFLLFRFVPTMRCNLRCSYCFLPRSAKRDKQLFFAQYGPDEWAAALRHFAQYDVEFYMWGGEPFFLKETYQLVKGFTAHDCVSRARIDTNMCFVDRIIERCPSHKVKVLGSWHTETFGYQAILDRACKLKERDMLGMINFVASDSNLNYLRRRMKATVHEMVLRFWEKGIFLNIAADFNYPDDPAYREMITQYMTEEDWEHIHGLHPPHGVPCQAGQSFFTVHPDGTLDSCGREGVVGNFIEGTLDRSAMPCPQQDCRSIISYPFRTDNSFVPQRHLEAYIERCLQRRSVTGILS
ncbi:MAG: radical SAM protein [Armatimonadota bacterium]